VGLPDCRGRLELGRGTSGTGWVVGGAAGVKGWSGWGEDSWPTLSLVCGGSKCGIAWGPSGARWAGGVARVGGVGGAIDGCVEAGGIGWLFPPLPPANLMGLKGVLGGQKQGWIPASEGAGASGLVQASRPLR
jgi:hypothetical protein